eukprot:6152153-Amphidinium_carterae.1
MSPLAPFRLMITISSGSITAEPSAGGQFAGDTAFPPRNADPLKMYDPGVPSKSIVGNPCYRRDRIRRRSLAENTS